MEFLLDDPGDSSPSLWLYILLSCYLLHLQSIVIYCVCAKDCYLLRLCKGFLITPLHKANFLPRGHSYRPSTILLLPSSSSSTTPGSSCQHLLFAYRMMPHAYFLPIVWCRSHSYMEWYFYWMIQVIPSPSPAVQQGNPIGWWSLLHVLYDSLPPDHHAWLPVPAFSWSQVPCNLADYRENCLSLPSLSQNTDLDNNGSMFGLCFYTCWCFHFHRFTRHCLHRSFPCILCRWYCIGTGTWDCYAVEDSAHCCSNHSLWINKWSLKPPFRGAGAARGVGWCGWWSGQGTPVSQTVYQPPFAYICCPVKQLPDLISGPQIVVR